MDKQQNGIPAQQILSNLQLQFRTTQSSQSRQQADWTIRTTNDNPNDELNVFDEPLQPCGGGPMSSSYIDDKCNEPSAGVHQICFISIGTNSNQFSLNTGQSDWSSQRANRNHCVCLGAWSLYQAKLKRRLIHENDEIQQQLKVKCDAVPKVAFSVRYIQKWNYWNGLQIDGQINDGVDALYHQCSMFANGDPAKLQALNSNYQQFKSQINQYL